MSFRTPIGYDMYACPGHCKAGMAKWCIYEDGEEQYAMVIRLCRVCRKTHHVENGQIVKGATYEPRKPAAGEVRHGRHRNYFLSPRKGSR